MPLDCFCLTREITFYDAFPSVGNFNLLAQAKPKQAPHEETLA